MDDSFDDLIIPDEWLKKKRCYSETEEDETSPVKQLKLNDSGLNGTDGSFVDSASNSDDQTADLSDHSISEPKSRIDPSDDNKSQGSPVDVSLSKNDTVNSSQDTEPFLYSRSSSENISTIDDPNSLPETLNGKALQPSLSSSSSSSLEKDSKVKLKKDAILYSSIYYDAKNLNSVFPDVDNKTIYDMLMLERDNKNRLDIVSSKLLEADKTISSHKSSSSTLCGNDGDNYYVIFKDLDAVMKEIPTADANEVYGILETIPPESDRIQKVIAVLRKGLVKQEPPSNAQKPFLLKKESTLLNDPVLKNDPIFRDMRDIAKMFPDKDRNEIYALLEANFAKANRVEVVVNEFLNGLKHQPKTTADANTSQEELPVQEDVEKLEQLFPDCDPNYLFEKLEQLKGKPERCQILASEMFDKKDYPKRQSQNDIQKVKVEKPQSKRDFTPEEFLEKFPEPLKTFENKSEVLSRSYREHVDVVLKNEFGMLKTGYIRGVLGSHGFRLLPSYRHISAELVAIPIRQRKNHGRFLKRLRTRKEPLPLESNEYFFHELWFTRNEQRVEDYIKQKEIEELMKFTEAKERGELYECCCCYDDECLFESLTSCPEGHLFCKVCVLRSTEAAFGEMKTKFPCLTGDCDQYLPLSTLQSIVPATLFSKIVSRIQEEEVQLANIPDLVTCPFCPFATVMPNQDDKVLKCLNPDCLKESCRLCQEENHIPLKCNEVESKAGRSMRTFIENYIAEAVIRKCHSCQKKFVKDSGCNKMTCICGATSCYACKAENIDYKHFERNKKCADTDPNKIHQRDMELAATEAKQKYQEAHPEATDVDLHANFGEWVQTLSNKGQLIADNQNNNNVEEDDSDSDGEPSSSYEEEEEYDYPDRYGYDRYRRRPYDYDDYEDDDVSVGSDEY